MIKDPYTAQSPAMPPSPQCIINCKVGLEKFGYSQVQPETLRKTKQVWVSLITNCKGADSPSHAWRQFVQHDRENCVKEWAQMTLDFYSVMMELGRMTLDPRLFFLRVDGLVKEMDTVERPTIEKDNLVDVEVRMLESSANCADRASIDHAVFHQKWPT